MSNPGLYKSSKFHSSQSDSFHISYSITDEMNGRIYRGHVRLESLRMKQDILFATSILVPFNATPHDKVRLRENILDFVAQRVKVLAAHEVGHTLGLAHNFAGSINTLNVNSGSVMDYPPPVIMVNDKGKLSLNPDCYMNRIGDFDKVAIDYAYRRFNKTDFDSYSLRHDTEDLFGLSEIDMDYQLAAERLSIGEKSFNYVYLNDQDLDKGDWRDSIWDMGAPIVALNNSLRVRKIALYNLHTNVLGTKPSHTPWSSILTESLPLVLLMHRYEVIAASKIIGGSFLEYGLIDDQMKELSTQPISFQYQKSAMQILLSAISVETLAIPESLVAVLKPLAFGYESNPIGGPGDTFHSRLLFDEFDRIAIIEAQVQLVLENLLERKRLERLITHCSQTLLGNEPCFTLSYLLESINAVIIPGDDHQLIEIGFLERVVPLYMYFNELLLLSKDEMLSVYPRAIITRHVKELISIFKSKSEDISNNLTLYNSVAIKWLSVYDFLYSQNAPFMGRIKLPAGGPI